LGEEKDGPTLIVFAEGSAKVSSLNLIQGRL